jgi:hypothetical protein
MKPLGFSLDEMRDLLGVLDRLDGVAEANPSPGEQEVLLERLAMFRVAAEARTDALRAQLRIAESFAGKLRRRLAQHRETTG